MKEKETSYLREIIYVADCKTCIHKKICPMPHPPYWLVDLQKGGCNMYMKEKKQRT